MNDYQTLLNRILALIIISVNLYLVPIGISIIKTGGGPFAFGILFLPFIFISLLFLIPAAMAWKRTRGEDKSLLVTNMAGTVWVVFWLWVWTARAA